MHAYLGKRFREVNLMLEGTCKKCGRKYHGWALKQPEHRVCGECGGEIEVEEVTITNANGDVLPEKEAEDFLHNLQRGVFYFPQR